MNKFVKRSISVILVTVLMTLNVCTVFARSMSDSIDAFAEKLLDYSSEDRENIFIMLNPLLSTDSGVDTLIEVYIDDYEPNAGGIFGSMLDKVFAKISQDQAKFILLNLKLIDEDLRSDFLDGFYDRKKISLSDETEEIIENMLSEYPNLEELCQEDNVSAGTIGYILSTLTEVNDGKELFDYNDGEFSINYINSSLKSGFNKNADKTNQDMDFDDILDDALDSLNDMSSSDKADVKVALNEVGLLKISSDKEPDDDDKDDDDKPSATKKPSSSSGGGGGGSSTAMTPVPTATPTPSVTPTATDVPKESKVHEFDAPSENYCLTDGNGKQIKLSYIENGKLYAKLDGESSDYTVSKIDVSFADIDGWYKPYITELYSKGIVNGKSLTEFYPKDTVTREEFVKILCELLDYTAEDTNIAFEDVPSDAWYAPYVSAAYKEKIVNGMSDTMFGVGNQITRQDMAVMCNNILKKYNITDAKGTELTFNDTADISDYASESVAVLVGLGIVNGDDTNCFNPKASLTRGESAKIAVALTKVLVNN